jgi:endo-beta-N-acetylglucosaminidase D
MTVSTETVFLFETIANYKPHTLKKITLLAVLLFGSHSFAQIINTAPYILTVDELKAWTQNGPTASTDLIATVPLASRFINTATQFNPASPNDMKIAYLPDGMNNFGNYYGEQSQFNLFNFTHWSYIDKFVWFGGTSTQSIQIPSSPWTNAAHKNGVKVFGNVFFSPTAFGGSTATLTNFLEQDTDGNFIAIPKMIAIMQYYNFDGWFINEETATNSATAQLMYAFVKNLTAQAEAVGKEIMWYDAMILSGSVGWQNRLNSNNSPFVQRDEDVNGSFETRVSSSIFINFSWSGGTLPNVSRTKAIAIGRSQYDVFTGADIWPGRNQGNFETNGNNFMTGLHENATTPYTSLGLFAPNCVFNNSIYTNFNNDPADYASFYNAENHLFSGDDNNPATVDATGFKGLANWIPEASVISTMPFETNFCTGHGTKKFTEGVQTGSDSWHDMNQQAILPTWQFAFSENNILSANWDFNDAYSEGNSLKVSGNLPANHPVDLMLYKTTLVGTQSYFQIDLKFKSNPAPAVNQSAKLLVVFASDPTQKYEFPLVGSSSTDWQGSGASIFFDHGNEIAMIGLRFESETAIPDYSFILGELQIYDGILGTADNSKINNFITVSYPDNEPAFAINWPNAKQIKYTVIDINGKVVSENNINLNKTTTYKLNTVNMAAGTYIVKFNDEQNRTETKKIIIK